MAYDTETAHRIRACLQDVTGVREKAMFGGLAFLINGNMAVAASREGGLLLRVEPAQTAALVEAGEASRFEMRGRAMDGWLRIDISELSDADVERWVRHGIDYASSLPPK